MISLIYSVSRVGTGLGKYSERLTKGLTTIEVPFEQIPVVKREYSIAGKPLFGNLSQVVGTRIKRPKGDVVHSLSPEVIHPKSDVVTVHDVIPLKMKDVFSGTYYRSKGNEMVFGRLKELKNIIVFSEVGKRELIELAQVSEDRISVVQQSVDHEQFYRQEDHSLKPDGKKLIVMVGDLNPRKRYDLLFEALGGNVEYEVIHIGPTNAWDQRKEELDRQVQEFSNIKMIGPVDQDTLRRYVSSAELLVHLSHAEGFGSTPIEAMACGTNVLVNDLDIFRETMGEMAFFTSLDPDEIRESVGNAIDHRRNSEELIKFSSKYSIENMAKATSRVYEKIDPNSIKP